MARMKSRAKTARHGTCNKKTTAADSYRLKAY